MRFNHRLILVLLASITVGTVGCGDDETSGSSGTGKPSGPYTITGALSYESVSYDLANEGLDYSKINVKPIRGVSIHLLREADNMVVAQTSSGDDGRYSVVYDGTEPVKLWIYAETTEPPVTIEDNTSSDAVYVLESEVLDPKTGTTLDVLAKMGWNGNGYDQPRAAAPFAILDTIYTAAHRFLDEVTPLPVFPTLKVNWSENNRPEDGSTSMGQIGTSSWDDEELYILGKQDIDTDEFDAHVIVHEWGHYFEAKMGRSDSPGGDHGYGDILDPRVALSEGWGNALGAMILDPDISYADSMGAKQSDGFSYSLEVNDLTIDASPGWFSEASMESLLFDLYDPANEPFDKVGLGLPGLYRALTDGQKNAQALTTIFSLMAALKVDHPDKVADLDTLVAYHSIDADFGFDPIQDEWGTGESHSGTVIGSLPVYIQGAVGGMYNLDFQGGTEYNTLFQSRFIRFDGTGGPVTITLSATPDVDLIVHQKGAIIASAESLSGMEQLSLNTQSGITYVVNVVGFDELIENYSAIVTITP